mmetsp:Transcript_72166/g.145187  ORF Transcript_72166/g.145187 Transcript_72166/m.145187 type:complete len:413 (-) Transcript_72166:140-1378(-)
MHSSQLPRALRSFHLPCSEGSYIAGCLKITGLGRYLLPPSPVQTVVRTLPHGLFREKIQWVRSFGGKFFLESTYQRSEAQHQSLGSTGGLDKEQVLHDVESAWPLDFHLSFEMPSAPRNIKVSSELSQHVRISHERTMLLGMLPFPKWLVSISIELDVHEEDGNEKKDGGQGGEPPRSSSESSDRTSGSGDGGWYLRCNVDSLGGRLRLIGYEGLLTILPLPEKNKSDSKPPARYVKGFHGVVLFDGHCNLCNASVDFLMRQDAQRQRLLFAPQQSPAANELLKAYGHDSGPAPSLLPQRRADNGDQGTFPGKKAKKDNQEGEAAEEGDSVLFFAADGRLHARSAAVLHTGACLGSPWSELSSAGLAVHKWVPGAAAALDVLYDVVGKRRVLWFGSKETCRIPTAAERRRFL